MNFQFKQCIKHFANKNINNTLPYEKRFWNKLEGFTPLPLPGSREFLKKLKQIGYKIIIWSGTKTDVLEKVIKTLSFSNYNDLIRVLKKK